MADEMKTEKLGASEMLKQVIKCSHFAAKKHKSQRRRDPEGTPYINHPIGVANILVEEADISDLTVIQAALLHDTIEDTDTTLEELKAEFGDEVAGIVLEVSDDKNLPKEQRKLLQIQNAPNLTYKARLVRLADKIYNLRDLRRVTPVGWSESRKREYFHWSLCVLKGIRGTNERMEKILDDIFASMNIHEDSSNDAQR
ncbi:guanosine-3',5'-bis(diphosphate) 3'-pyrophosphohydrolase MESH1-like [Liolophura sinensis]|uniref:guanosine-3',5'-bis(diphosphate) 3'-pyrophosphohydrolase MESH1-like n=1 Tax=Liolophura sinensis TaxID=3198878 RepID=UPI003158B7EF